VIGVCDLKFIIPGRTCVIVFHCSELSCQKYFHNGLTCIFLKAYIEFGEV
jgi:hypothetical protein